MFTIRMAEKNIQINNRYDYIKDYCKNYIVNNVAPDFIVQVSDDEILAEKSKEYSSTREYLETLAVYRKICERLAGDNIILVHSSVLMVDGQAVMFLAPSGTGKSTHSRLWRQVYGDRVTMINDDKPLVSVHTDDEGTHLTVYGTPWCGKHGIETNTSAPVKAIFILKRNEINEATKMGFRDAFPYIFNQIYRPDNEILMRKTLLLATTFAQNVDIYELGCNMKEEAAKVAYRAVFGVAAER
jgi:hypothetical protein